MRRHKIGTMLGVAFLVLALAGFTNCEGNPNGSERDAFDHNHWTYDGKSFPGHGDLNAATDDQDNWVFTDAASFTAGSYRLTLTIAPSTGSVFALPSIGANIISASCPGTHACSSSLLLNLGSNDLWGLEFDSIGYTGNYDFTLVPS